MKLGLVAVEHSEWALGQTRDESDGQKQGQMRYVVGSM